VLGKTASVGQHLENSHVSVQSKGAIIRKAFRNVAFSGIYREFATEVPPLFVLKVVTKVREVSGFAD
jgi:hypothetical protein